MIFAAPPRPALILDAAPGFTLAPLAFDLSFTWTPPIAPAPGFAPEPAWRDAAPALAEGLPPQIAADDLPTALPGAPGHVAQPAASLPLPATPTSLPMAPELLVAPPPSPAMPSLPPAPVILPAPPLFAPPLFALPLAELPLPPANPAALLPAALPLPLPALPLPPADPAALLPAAWAIATSPMDRAAQAQALLDGLWADHPAVESHAPPPPLAWCML
ncbi:hypothetical protein [Sediminicoccus sp. KRV36]|uniref:hypothetical protein n=1 Tax=Sediminicoccus sp. KRV36 TaxID=3133721 RepID=UPI002010B902|nr:hypothetical protein [Sediminicoccus rosea]UPY37895.1 hypothetical protein LHU95_04145 [Sediminicoccus rosea]